jgi:hypothetical protein
MAPNFTFFKSFRKKIIHLFVFFSCIYFLLYLVATIASIHHQYQNLKQYFITLTLIQIIINLPNILTPLHILLLIHLITHFPIFFLLLSVFKYLCFKFYHILISIFTKPTKYPRNLAEGRCNCWSS